MEVYIITFAVLDLLFSSHFFSPSMLFWHKDSYATSGAAFNQQGDY